jgi:hypothetical protein
MSATGILFTTEGAREVTLSGDELVDKIRKPLTWQPIETAPVKTPVLITGGKPDWDGDNSLVPVPSCVVALWISGDWLVALAEGGYVGVCYYNPTHWMPLPEPPDA